jgi:hypothetical protein
MIKEQPDGSPLDSLSPSDDRRDEEDFDDQGSLSSYGKTSRSSQARKWRRKWITMRTLESEVRVCIWASGKTLGFEG